MDSAHTIGRICSFERGSEETHDATHEQHATHPRSSVKGREPGSGPGRATMGHDAPKVNQPDAGCSVPRAGDAEPRRPTAAYGISARL
jgi:hypothetical protein